MCLQWVKYASQTPQQYAYALCACVCVLHAPPRVPSNGFLFALTLTEWSAAGGSDRQRGSHEKLKRDFGAAAAENRLNSNLNKFFLFRAFYLFFRWPRWEGRAVSVFWKCLSSTHKLKDDISQHIGHVLPVRERQRSGQSWALPLPNQVGWWELLSSAKFA